MNKLMYFLERFNDQEEAGLVVVEAGGADVAMVAQLLSEQGFKVCDALAETQQLLISGRSVAVHLNDETAKDLYDLLGDYREPVGLIQCIDSQTLKVSLKSFDR